MARLNLSYSTSLMTAVSIVFAASTLAPTAMAEDGSQGWSGEASVTGSNSTGNTERSDIGAGIKLDNIIGRWTHKVAVQADYGEDRGRTRKKRAAGSYQLNRNIGDRVFLFGEGNASTDDFGPFVQAYFVGGGIGYQLLEPNGARWDVEGGLGYRWQKAQSATTPIAQTFGRVQEEVAVRAASDFSWSINDNVRISNDTELLYSSSDTYIWNDVSLTADLMGNLAARLSYRIDHHTDVPQGRENTDTITRVGLVYKIN